MSTDINKNIPTRNEKVSYDPFTLPDYDVDFISSKDLEQFARALTAPQTEPVTALNDWRPINQKVRRPRLGRKASKRRKDEIREGFVYTLLRFPLLAIVFGWIVFLFIAYNITRLYIYAYEHFVTWTGRRETIRRRLQQASSYEEWCLEAQKLDEWLGNEEWKRNDAYSYYNHQTVQKVTEQLSELKSKIEIQHSKDDDSETSDNSIQDLKILLESCIKNNFVGVENPRLYSETYLGTKDLVQLFIDLTEKGLKLVLASPKISQAEKFSFFKHLELNYGRTALCLSGGATFAYGSSPSSLHAFG